MHMRDYSSAIELHYQLYRGLKWPSVLALAIHTSPLHKYNHLYLASEANV